ncbi:hypothetical protein Golomagni_04165 [Golovinomyces magnicellulatus]|nr:hypothetical protein Golomagni_04165 [Golovinomyces magnicellulatus]
MSLPMVNLFATSTSSRASDITCCGDKKETNISSSGILLPIANIQPEAILSPLIKQLKRISKEIPEEIPDRKRCARIREKKARIKNNKNVYSIVKPLLFTSISSSRKKSRTYARQKIDKSEPNDYSVSEKRCDVLLEKNPLQVLLSSPDDVVEIREGKEDLDSDHLQTLALSMRNNSTNNFKAYSDSESLTHVLPYIYQISSTTPRLRVRKRPLHAPRHMCLIEDHPLCNIDSVTNSLETKTPPNFSNSMIQQNGRNNIRSRSRSILNSNISSLCSFKSGTKSVSSLVKPFPIIGNFFTKFTTTDSTEKPSIDEDSSLQLDSMPTPVLRRYLNPNTSAPIEAHVPKSLSRTKRSKRCLVSIQMQTYRISTSRKRSSYILISRRTSLTNDDIKTEKMCEPKMRQRDMRENSDFMRVAVMERLMRKRGKLDNHRPGRARFALPPRTISVEPYETTDEGIPVRWVSHTV